MKEVIERTRKSFGYQWTVFSEMSCDFEQNFLNYIYPVDKQFFRDKLGLDAGCGFGRHIYFAAKYGASMVGMDFSRAIESTRKNTRGLKNVNLVQADIYRPPFREKAFDFVYSIGVLHHLPVPEEGFRQLLKLVKEGGSIFIWVYSDTRKVSNFLLGIVRAITTRMPLPLLKPACFFAAVFDYIFGRAFIPFLRLPRFRELIEKHLPRVAVYADYPFQVIYADWFDRLSAPVRFYYNRKILEGWFRRFGLSNVVISPTGNYGWRAYGKKQD